MSNKEFAILVDEAWEDFEKDVAIFNVQNEVFYLRPGSKVPEVGSVIVLKETDIPVPGASHLNYCKRITK